MFEKLQEVYVYIYNLLFKTNNRLSEMEEKIKQCEEFRLQLKKKRSNSCPPLFVDEIEMKNLNLSNSNYYMGN